MRSDASAPSLNMSREEFRQAVRAELERLGTSDEWVFDEEDFTLAFQAPHGPMTLPLGGTFETLQGLPLERRMQDLRREFDGLARFVEQPPIELQFSALAGDLDRGLAQMEGERYWEVPAGNDVSLVIWGRRGAGWLARKLRLAPEATPGFIIQSCANWLRAKVRETEMAPGQWRFDGLTACSVLFDGLSDRVKPVRGRAVFIATNRAVFQCGDEDAEGLLAIAEAARLEVAAAPAGFMLVSCLRLEESRPLVGWLPPEEPARSKWLALRRVGLRWAYWTQSRTAFSADAPVQPFDDLGEGPIEVALPSSVPALLPRAERVRLADGRSVDMASLEGLGADVVEPVPPLFPRWCVLKRFPSTAEVARLTSGDSRFIEEVPLDSSPTT